MATSETRQKNDDAVRVIEKDAAAQLVDKQSDIQELERRINALQSDVIQLAGLTGSSPSRSASGADAGLLRLGQPAYFSNLNRYGPSQPGFVPPIGLGGPSTPLLGFGTAAPSLSSAASGGGPGEAMTARDLVAMPFITKQPGVNIVDAGDQFVVQVELPGSRKKDVEILGSDRSITLTAQVRPDAESNDGTVVLGEVTPTVYRRTIHLPALCVTAKTRAALRDGVLTLFVPKRDPSEAMRRIDVAYG